jgi:hypothetical protein
MFELIDRLRYTTRFAAGSLCCADPGVGGDGSPGGGGGAGDSKPDWGAFTKALEAIPASINNELGKRLDGLTHTVREASAPLPVAEEPPDFNTMDNGQIAAYMQDQTTKAIKAALDSALQPFAEKLVGLETQQLTTTGKAEVDRLKATHKDFVDWKDEMMSLAGEQPTLSIARLYSIVRAENPDKAKTLDTRYNPVIEKPRPFAMTHIFGGDNSNGQQAKTLSKAEASMEAAREVASRHSGVLNALRDL